MNLSIGYIYVRNHIFYDNHNACKLGKASNIPERDSQYATGEITRGKFELVFEISIKQMSIIENLLKSDFNKLNIKYDAGTEFFDKKIIELIEPIFIKHKFEYKRLSDEEIDNLVRINRVKKTLKKINVKSLIKILKKDKFPKVIKIPNKVIKINKLKKNIILYTPRTDQLLIIDNSISYFQQNSKGILVLMCGVGKTLISLWITQKLNSKTILIGVPNILLLTQWEEVIRNLFLDIPCLIVSCGINSTDITQFLKNNKNNCIVITTYSSAYKIYTATQNSSFIFDMKINDEVHHLTTKNMNSSTETKKYVQMLNISSNKQLSLTATLKQIEDLCNDDNKIVSNTDIEYFGEIIDRKCLLWAINKNIICDYSIQTIISDEEELETQLKLFNIIEENDKRLFLSVFASLKSIFDNHSHHLLIYSNNKENSEKLVKYINLLLKEKYFEIPELYTSSYHSEMKAKDQKNIIDRFEKSKFGIITCVYCLGEGWNFPLLDAVVFAENMTSNIRIVQSALRASRKDKNDINKKTKIILPILNRSDDWLENNENRDFKKARTVIYEMGLEDETIVYKIKVFKINIKKYDPKDKPLSKKDTNDEFGEYNDELTQQLRLKTVKRTQLTTTYEKARKIIAEKNIKSKECYIELCDRDNRLSKEPEIIYEGRFTNWIEYLSIERIYYDIETCKIKINEYISHNIELKENILDLSILNTKLCKLDLLFPPNGLWVEYYNIKDLTEIININSTNKYKKFNSLL